MNKKPRERSNNRIAFGDFQTPDVLVADVVDLVHKWAPEPASIMEPTCGVGNFLSAAAIRFDGARDVLGIEINPDYVATARRKLVQTGLHDRVKVEAGDFFTIDWKAVMAQLPEPLLVIGNPPWVTNAGLGAIGASNLPRKTNFQGHRGIDAVTGKSNFDISEWMLLEMLQWFEGRDVTLAMLCKTAVARKVLRQAWENGAPMAKAALYEIDAARYFDASVSACLFLMRSGTRASKLSCPVFPDLHAKRRGSSLGFSNGGLLADVEGYTAHVSYDGPSCFRWRSGVKHDCSKVMELTPGDNGYQNGLGEVVDLESDFVYPMLKSSDLANGRIDCPRKAMIVTQQKVGQDTSTIAETAPKTWEYLNGYAELLDGRRSVIYRSKPRFSVFGVGDYSFAPWKVAVAGFYREFCFRVVAPVGGKPVVLDDTAYFIPCRTEAEAELLERLLHHESTQTFLRSLVFWDAKRPITVDLLRRLDFEAVADAIAEIDLFRQLFSDSQFFMPATTQPSLFEKTHQSSVDR